MSSALDALLMVAAIFGGVLGFVGFWMGICVLLGLMSGWRGLANRYETRSEPPSQSETVYAMLGLVSYKGVLELASTPEGLDMRVMALFRAGHPPLRIPWQVIGVEGEHIGLFGQQTKVRLGNGGPLLRVPSEVWAKLRFIGIAAQHTRRM